MRTINEIVDEACRLWGLPNRQGISCHADIGVTIAVLGMDESRKRLIPVIHEQRKKIQELEEKIKKLQEEQKNVS